MPEELAGNCLVAQSGGPTAVVNATLAGVITEALNHECIEEIYGGWGGLTGVLHEELTDLASESQQTIRGLRHTPGAALGTCRYPLKKTPDAERLMQVFRAHNIRYFFYIGGNDSMDTARRIVELAREAEHEMRVIGIPKTVDNDLVVTDHTPGYGSIVKYVCSLVKEVSCDNESMGRNDLVFILEVMGRNSGWVAAGSMLAKRRDRPSDPPHLIYLPEVPFQNGKFLEDVKKVLSTEKFCFIVAGEGLVDGDGNYIATSGAQTDSFGHTQLGGVGEQLRVLAEENLGVKARSARPGHSLRSAAHCASQVDNDEAFYIGRAAVAAAVTQEVTGKMVTLLRGETDYYQCETGLADLGEVARGVKTVPLNWVNEDGVSMNYQFFKYAFPLVQGEVPVPFEDGVPNFARLGRIRIEKRLAPYTIE